jgi:hypothetical protein
MFLVLTCPPSPFSGVGVAMNAEYLIDAKATVEKRSP